MKLMTIQKYLVKSLQDKQINIKIQIQKEKLKKIKYKIYIITKTW